MWTDIHNIKSIKINEQAWSREYSSRFATFSETFRGLSGGGNLMKIVSPQESFSRLKPTFCKY